MFSKLISWTLIVSLLVSQFVLAANLVPCIQSSPSTEHNHSMNQSHHHDTKPESTPESMMHVSETMNHNMHDTTHSTTRNNDHSNGHSHNDDMDCCGDDCACPDYAFQAFTLQKIAVLDDINLSSQPAIASAVEKVDAFPSSLYRPPSVTFTL